MLMQPSLSRFVSGNSPKKPKFFVMSALKRAQSNIHIFRQADLYRAASGLDEVDEAIHPRCGKSGGFIDRARRCQRVAGGVIAARCRFSAISHRRASRSSPSKTAHRSGPPPLPGALRGTGFLSRSRSLPFPIVPYRPLMCTLVHQCAFITIWRKCRETLVIIQAHAYN